MCKPARSMLLHMCNCNTRNAVIFLSAIRDLFATLCATPETAICLALLIIAVALLKCCPLKFSNKMYTGLPQACCASYSGFAIVPLAAYSSQTHVAGQQLRVQRLCQQWWIVTCLTRTELCTLGSQGYFTAWHHLQDAHIQQQAVRPSWHVGVVRTVLDKCIP